MANAKRITAKQLRKVLSYDSETGQFTWRVDRMCGRYFKQYAAHAGDRAGTVAKDGRVLLRVGDCHSRGHILAWVHYYGRWPNAEIDHIDGDASNNRIKNLRLANRYINNQNLRRAQKNNSVGLLGVTPRKDKFIAQIGIGKTNRYLGIFKTKEDAHQAYLIAKRTTHEGCTL